MSGNSKKTQFWLLAVFVGPLLIAIVMYLLRDFLPTSTPTAHGELIHPAQPITDIHAHLLTDGAINLDHFQGKWSYLAYFPKECDLKCEAALFKIRQAKQATGREVNRVQYTLLVEEGKSSPQLDSILQRHPQITAGTLKKLATESEPHKKLQPGVIYLLDPLGNMMMQYDDSATSKGMHKDIKKLLKISGIG